MDISLLCVGLYIREIRDFIDDEGGFICKSIDAKFFADAFKKLRGNPEMRTKTGNHNRKRQKDIQKELFDIYQSVVKRKRGLHKNDENCPRFAVNSIDPIYDFSCQEL